MIGKGDYFQSQVNYTEGALRYIFQTPNSNWGFVDGHGVGFGVVSDAVFGGTAAGASQTSLELTTAWNVNAAYEHFWNPAWRTSVYGGYAAVSYSSSANAMLCSVYGVGNGTGVGTAAIATAGCDNDWNTWWVGTRTQWNIDSNFYIGLDVLYQKLQSASTFNGLSTATVAAPAATAGGPGTTVGDQDNWSVRLRIHRDFYP
jgi:hypothetical protein